jgi:hypothetical protein
MTKNRGKCVKSRDNNHFTDNYEKLQVIFIHNYG